MTAARLQYVPGHGGQVLYHTTPAHHGGSCPSWSPLRRSKVFKGVPVGAMARDLLVMSKDEVRQLIEDYCTAH